MRGRLPLPHVAVAVALGVVSGVYIYRPIFQPPGSQQSREGAVEVPADAAVAAAKRP